MQDNEPAIAITAPGTEQGAAMRALKEIGFGSIAGMLSKVFEHPFDLTKVRLQSQVLDAVPGTPPRFTGPVDCLRKTWHGEGIRGLYRGLPAPIVGAMAENASLFLAYAEFQAVIRRVAGTSSSPEPPLSLPMLALAAAGAGAVTSFLLTPIELVKCKMQVQMLGAAPPNPSSLQSHTTTATSALKSKPPGPLAIIQNVLRTTGVRGLWLGHTGTLIRETGGTAAWFGTREWVARQLVALDKSPDLRHSSAPRRPLRPWESALSGACGGAAFNFVLFPADTVKSSMQTASEMRSAAPATVLSAGGGALAVDPVPPSFVGTFRALYKAGGIRGLYAGCGITVARSIPSSAIIFLVYDGLVARFG